MKYLFFILFLGVVLNSFSQNQYAVFFKNKNGVTFNPFTYFDAKAIERRMQLGISLYDSTDFPVSEEYSKIISQKVEKITGCTRWFNAVFVEANSSQISEVKTLPFVQGVEELTSRLVLCSDGDEIKIDSTQKEFLKNQTGHLQGDLFRNVGFTGNGIRIAIFDGGFPNVDKHPAFEHIRKANKIIKTWDFTSDKENVYLANSHGTNVLSCIAGLIDGIPVGLATDAEFLLARTEVGSEPFSEEKNWLQAVEWADKNGAKIINSSLGYTDSRYFPWEMNGKRSLVSRAANIAASKGILVVNAAGNEGTNKWKKIITPADADSVLTIGGINPNTYYHMNYSSYGPSADWRLKPNVSAFSHVIAASPNNIHETDGTSFSSPLVAGFAACAWQSNLGLTNMQLFLEIEKSATLYPYFDYAHGYGIPQASYFLNSMVSVAKQPTVEIIVNENAISVKTLLLPSNKTNNKYLYYHIANSKAILKKYAVVEVLQNNVLTLDPSDFEKGDVLRIYYLGYMLEKQF
ncbi:MAG: S8 family serine peptidase [Bacteroidia bacterium]|nr:S8 family serine peptidase [Bacteroidia bacterium]